MATQLEIRNLHVRTEEREILRGVDLVVRRGELHALMGPNGSGKSTLANTIMGHPAYEVTDGEILFDGENITELAVLVCADDVSASHGGTVGELDESLIFYMQTRGLTRPQAVRVIVDGFFEPLIVQLDDPPLGQQIRERIGAKLTAAADDIERYALAR